MHFQVCKGRLGFYFGYEARLISYTRAYCCVWWTSPPTCENAATSLSWLNFLFLQRREKVRGGGEDLFHPHPCSTGCVSAPRTAASCSQASSYFNLSASSHRVWRLRTETALSPPRSHKSSARYCVLTLALVMFRPKDSTHQSSQKVGPAQFSPTQRSVS